MQKAATGTNPHSLQERWVCESPIPVSAVPMFQALPYGLRVSLHVLLF